MDENVDAGFRYDMFLVFQIRIPVRPAIGPGRWSPRTQSMKIPKLISGLVLAACFHVSGPMASGRTLVVDQRAPEASDTNDGGEGSPLKTIQAGADRAMPGDTVLVKADVYREWVDPPRGGTREKPIRYLAAPGEEVSIRGSERVTSWVNQGGMVWTVELDNSFFGTFNPFSEPLSG